MTISFPIDAPTAFRESDVTLTYAGAVVKDPNPYNFITQIQEWDGSAWGLTIALDPNDRETMAPWMAFLLSLRGPRGSFMWGPVLLGTPLGAVGGTPLVKGAGQTGFTLVTDGWPNSTLVLKKGDLFQVGTRFHMITADATTSGSGEVTLDFCPAIREAGVPADNAPIITSNPRGMFRLVDSQVPILRAQRDKLIPIQVTAEEAL